MKRRWAVRFRRISTESVDMTQIFGAECFVENRQVLSESLHNRLLQVIEYVARRQRAAFPLGVLEFHRRRVLAMGSTEFKTNGLYITPGERFQ